MNESQAISKIQCSVLAWTVWKLNFQQAFLLAV